jgi:hypothetical protein
MFAPPQASMYLPQFKVLLLQVLVFDSAAAGLMATGHRTAAAPMGVIVLVDAAPTYARAQRRVAPWVRLFARMRGIASPRTSGVGDSRVHAAANNDRLTA